ncbi:Oxoglutarate and iron-dependent oxygenase degradation C-term-domain-containing protein [Baffinella frigidus]|nr:Oxoglutarate and iron-dependent oxygenase degradation C-term-domain-containing protein [Cryptophyta sp. CCMP2293]
MPGAKRNAEGPGDEPGSKKVAGGSAETLLSPLIASIFHPEERKKTVEEFATSAPYHHAVIAPFAQEDRLRAVHDELVQNLTANLKESDLFKVYQTCDLANLGRNGVMEELAAKMPQLISLRDAIYSPEFKSFVQEVTGCGELSDQVDCATNLHTQGCHLLCHDDVIGTRKVSYIIYLTSPDKPWTREDGGALQLYASVTPGTPATFPSKILLPIFNTIALFNVEPGVSFHSVEEVYSERPRMSIQGWFHGPPSPANTKSMATVNQLIAGTANAAVPFVDIPAALVEQGALSASDLKVLGEFVNPAYLRADGIGKIREKFEEESCVELRDFLRKDVALELGRRCTSADRRDKLGRARLPDDQVGIGSKWQAVGPPHMQRYLTFAETKEPEVGALDLKTSQDAGDLLEEVRARMRSAPFARLLAKLTSVTVDGARGEVRRFRPGLDYTVAHYGTMAAGKSLNAPSLSQLNQAGGGAQIGGFECYIEAEEDCAAEASDVYRMDPEDDGPLVQTIARSNTLSLVLLDQGVMRFVKYVGGAAPGSRWDIANDYRIVPGDSDDDEEGEGEAGGVAKEDEEEGKS